MSLPNASLHPTVPIMHVPLSGASPKPKQSMNAPLFFSIVAHVSMHATNIEIYKTFWCIDFGACQGTVQHGDVDS